MVQGPLVQTEQRRWYVIHTYSGYEDKVRKNLLMRIESMDVKDKIFQVVVPTEEVIEVKEGKQRTVTRKLFPGYVLVEMVMDEKTWYVVRNTPGVTGFVTAGDKPVPLEESEVKTILRQREEPPRLKVPFIKGETVIIGEGPFADMTGIVDQINLDRGKVRVLLSLLGRETPVELDLSAVRKV
ncbi:MAG: transcription termination/antitermination factor NusG [Chloroflexi bacterium]|nr:transcription termination/antitermination factor NusG [Chloroflexota bacterium]